MRLIMSLIIFCTTTPAFAEWISIATSNRGTEYLVDEGSILDLGSTVYVRSLVNYSSKQSTGERSSISDTIIKCDSFFTKDTRLKTFTKKFARGKQLSDDDLVGYNLDFWRATEKGSVERAFVTRLCSRVGG